MHHIWKKIGIGLGMCAGCASPAAPEPAASTPPPQVLADYENPWGIDNPCGSYEGALCCGTGFVPCNGSLSCVDGTCQLVSGLARLPLTTLDLRVKTCDDAGWYHLGSYEQTLFEVAVSGADPNAEPSTFWLNAPGRSFQPNQEYTLGLRIPSVTTLGDIQGLELRVYNGDICVDSLELLASEQVVFSKSYTDKSGYILGTYPPYNEGGITITHEELILDQQQRDAAQLCALPTSIPGDAFQRAITGAIGNALIDMHSDGVIHAGFWDGDYLQTSKAGDDTVHVDTRFHARVKGGGFEADVKVSLAFDLTIQCGATQPTDEMPNPTGNSISLVLSPITVTDVDGNVLVDIITDLFVSNDGLAKSINEHVAPFRKALENVVKNLLACPALTVDDASPPGVAISYDVLTFWGIKLPESVCQ